MISEPEISESELRIIKPTTSNNTIRINKPETSKSIIRIIKQATSKNTIRINKPEASKIGISQKLANEVESHSKICYGKTFRRDSSTNRKAKQRRIVVSSNPGRATKNVDAHDTCTQTNYCSRSIPVNIFLCRFYPGGNVETFCDLQHTGHMKKSVSDSSSPGACREPGVDPFVKLVDSDNEMDVDECVNTEYSNENLSESENTRENDFSVTLNSNKKQKKRSKDLKLCRPKPEEKSNEKGKKLFLCSVCSEQCDSLIKLQMHFKLNHKASTLSFQCYFCEASFTTYGNLHKHLNSVHFMKRYFCDLCDNSYRCRRNLFIHKTKAHSYMIEDPWKCKWCDQHFTRYFDFKAHCGGKFVCEKEDCIKLFNCRHGLTEHMNKDHGFPCDMCDKVCNSAKRLYDHKRDHMAQLKCSICGKCFAYQSQLDIHVDRHKNPSFSARITTNKPFKCETCGMSFIRLKLLQFHVRQKHREPKFRCPVCDKKIFYKGHLTKHMKSHLDDKIYTCPICNSTFSNDNSLTSHCENVHS